MEDRADRKNRKDRKDGKDRKDSRDRKGGKDGLRAGRDLISVVVPCYNEEESLPLFYEEISRVAGSMDQVDFELVFVDDGSRDGTLEILRGLARRDSRCRFLSFSRNFGKEAGMYAGLAEAAGDYCVLMDADLQHPPALLPEMYRVVGEEGWDCCGGLRVGREGDGRLRSLLSRSFYRIGQKLTKLDMTDGHGDFRMMSRPVVDAILNMREYNRYMKGLFSFVGFQTKWIPYENVERACGQTKWNFKSLFSYAFEGILAFSTTPLKLAGAAGMLLMAAGLLFLLVNLIQSIWVTGALTSMDLIVTLILVLSGLQMLFLYIIGAYLSKDYLENKKRPLYIVRERSARGRALNRESGC